MVWQAVLMAVTLIVLVVASYSDLKVREVPDWLSYSLIFSGLGLRFIFSFFEDWSVFLSGMFGFLICLGFGYLFYYTSFWGGGDSKLLMGMGGVIGLSWSFDLVWFFLGLLFFGAIIGLLWSLIVSIRHWKRFVKDFKGLLRSIKRSHIFVLLVSFGFLVISLFVWYLWPIGVLVLGAFYLLCFVKTIESSGFVKKLSVDKLVEGDWLAEDVVIGKDTIKKGKGLGKTEIWKLRGKLKKVLVKEGIPFVPSFLLAYLVVLFKVEVLGWLMGFLG